jgi:putative ABC transport system permease protein
VIAKCRARVVSVWRNLVHRDRAERLLDEELRAAVDLLIDEKVSAGMRPDEARRVARLELGSLESLKDAVRDARTGASIDAIVRDIRYTLRLFKRSPGFTAIAIATLALGIGVNAAMFSAVDAVLIRPLPYADADRLVMVWDDSSRTGSAKFYSTPPEWSEWRRHNTVFSDIAASQPGDAALSSDSEPEDLAARKVTGNFWTVLGAQPLLGRVFTEDEDTRGARVVVISHGLWQRRFGASPGIVGRTITLNDQPYEVVGVMPRAFSFMPVRDVDIWMPTSFSAGMLRNWGWHDVHCVARLKPGVTLQQARESMAALSLRVSAPHVKPPRAAVVTPLRKDLAGNTRTALIALLCA